MNFIFHLLGFVMHISDKHTFYADFCRWFLSLNDHLIYQTHFKIYRFQSLIMKDSNLMQLRWSVWDTRMLTETFLGMYE